MDDVLKVTSHRPFPLPDLPWMMTQTWENLLFMHWPVDTSAIRALVPAELELDTWEGQAWLTISPFQVKHQRFRIMPEIPLLNEYLELNVRTYVKRGGKHGVYFFSLDANLAPAVLAANGLLALPYKHAEMEFKRAGEDAEGETGFLFTNKRISAENGFGKYQAAYRPESAPFVCKPGSLEHWLVERYCLFTTRDGKVLRGDIHHLPWDVGEAWAAVSVNTMSPVSLYGDPILQYCESKKVLMFPFVED
ncbi:hypothetical protein AM500_02755 [Bacillus sp. FJAT-18017]|uniref:YqjF family protein n=1 Tax=Bacillus sp. FJAT-18017 TaxID=1705566 RepID=UPI0006AF9733|nr:DUF2071 domain-containing protein [Bacillus sp. FJAT-18017]ALC88837.1 hypothetical protein AM500_02755 [Bacillus sp. FJAT-18017]